VGGAISPAEFVLGESQHFGENLTEGDEIIGRSMRSRDSEAGRGF
jgi:hypothetical protein